MITETMKILVAPKLTSKLRFGRLEPLLPYAKRSTTLKCHLALSNSGNVFRLHLPVCVFEYTLVQVFAPHLIGTKGGSLPDPPNFTNLRPMPSSRSLTVECYSSLNVLSKRIGSL